MQMQTATADTAYRTRSLYLAAFLIASYLPLVDVKTDVDGRRTFCLGGDPEILQERLRAYRSGTASVNATRYGDEIRRLKAVVHGDE